MRMTAGKRPQVPPGSARRPRTSASLPARVRRPSGSCCEFAGRHAGAGAEKLGEVRRSSNPVLRAHSATVVSVWASSRFASRTTRSMNCFALRPTPPDVGPCRGCGGRSPACARARRLPARSRSEHRRRRVGGERLVSGLRRRRAAADPQQENFEAANVRKSAALRAKRRERYARDGEGPECVSAAQGPQSLAPAIRLELITCRLTAGCSAN